MALTTKGHKKTLQQQKQQESAVANVAATQTIQTAIVSQDTKLSQKQTIEVGLLG